MSRPTMPLMRVSVPTMALLLLSLGSCTEPNPYLGVCGNGVHEPDFDEECDDGAGNGDAKACSMTCRIATCGDGVVQPDLGEDCDLGDQNSNNGSCTLDCQFAQCGDGLLQPGEACDDANANRWPADGEPGCSIYCAPLPYCGDGSTDPDLDEEPIDHSQDDIAPADQAQQGADGEERVSVVHRPPPRPGRRPRPRPGCASRPAGSPWQPAP